MGKKRGTDVTRVAPVLVFFQMAIPHSHKAMHGPEKLFAMARERPAQSKGGCCMHSLSGAAGHMYTHTHAHTLLTRTHRHLHECTHVHTHRFNHTGTHIGAHTASHIQIQVCTYTHAHTHTGTATASS